MRDRDRDRDRDRVGVSGRVRVSLSRRAFLPLRADWSKRRCSRKWAKKSVSMLRPEHVKMRM